MTDDSLLWTHKPGPCCRPKPGEPLWAMRINNVTWSAELFFRGESVGWEAQLKRNGELVIGRTFVLRELAVEWAMKEKAHAGERVDQ